MPLYKSMGNLDIIRLNIDAVEYDNVEFLIGDRHGFDEAIDILQEQYGHDNRFRFFRNKDQRDWRINTNHLISEARGKYYRFMPHDDYFRQCGLKEMVIAFKQYPESVLVYSPVDYFDPTDPEHTLFRIESGTIYPNSQPWTLDVALDFNPKFYCPASFRGLVDLEKLRSKQLTILESKFFADRYYLFSLALIGRFTFIEAGYSERAQSEVGITAEWERKFSRKDRITNFWRAYTMSAKYIDLVLEAASDKFRAKFGILLRLIKRHFFKKN